MYITTINSKSQSKPYKLLIKNENNLPHITIIDGNKSYSCLVTQNCVEKFAKIFEITSKQYIENVWKLISPDSNTNTQLVDIAKNVFLLYKNSFITYFTNEITEVNHSETLRTCMEHLYTENLTQKEENKKLSVYNEDLQLELNNYKTKLDESIENATERESRLYSCFIQVLNEKKRYIQHIRNFIDKKDLDKVGQSKGKRRKADISDSEPECDSSDKDNDYNTDDEKDVTSNQNVSDETCAGTSTAALSAMDVSVDSRILDSDSDSNDTFLTALPPREQRKQDTRVVHMSPVKSTTTHDEEENEISPDAKSRNEVNSMPKIPDTPDTPVEAFSTQDLIEGM